MSEVFYIVLEKNDGKQFTIGSFDNEMQTVAFLCDVKTIIEMVKEDSGVFTAAYFSSEVVPKQPVVKEEDKIKSGNKIVPFKKRR